LEVKKWKSVDSPSFFQHVPAMDVWKVMPATKFFRVTCKDYSQTDQARINPKFLSGRWTAGSSDDCLETGPAVLFRKIS
jgi:hypothetical protein